MHARNKAIAVLVALSFMLFVPAAEATNNCSLVNKYYPSGVSASKLAKNKGAEIIGTPRVRASVYKKYQKLDADRDRIVCEIEKTIATPKPADPNINLTASTNQFIKNINSSASYSDVITIINSPTVHSSFLSIVQRSLDKAVDATDEIALPSNIRVYLFTVKDASWLNDRLVESGASMYMPAPSAQAYIARSKSDDCGQSFIAKVGTSSMFFQCTPYDGEGRDASAHEYFHMLQSELGQFGTPNPKTPLWMFEGAPTYFSDLLANRMDPYQRIGNPMITKDEVVNKLIALEVTIDIGGNVVESNNGYQFGYFAVKTLIDSYGYDKFVEFNKLVSTSLNWKTLFNQIYGNSPQQFYQEVAESIHSLYN